MVSHGGTLAGPGLPSLLEGWELTCSAAMPAAALCAGHLAALGARVSSGRAAGEAADGHVVLRGGQAALDCTVEWRSGGLGSEAVVQALSGLMWVHGRDAGAPRRLGLDVASVAAAIVTAQSVLACLIAQRRGLEVRAARTSVTRAALLFLNHHLAIATSGDDFPFDPGEGAGPPFATADGQWVEIEALSGEDWQGFWRRLGVGRPDVVSRAWLPFVYRYLAGSCALPSVLHDTTRQHALAQIRQAAEASGVALSLVRTRPGPPPPPPLKLSPLNCTTRDDLGEGAAHRGGAPADERPLSGLRVIEVTSRLQGPLAGLLLRQLGAEVVKVEPPGGDFGRISPPLAGDVGAAYLAYNRGKHVVELDYKRSAGRAQLVDLIADADVVLHNWRPGRAGALGLDAGDVACFNPAIVYAYASGWGDIEEPPSPIAGDFLVQAHSGCGAGLNPPGEPPLPSRITLVDVAGGLLACEGVLAGLYQRASTGRGCRIDTSLLTAALMLQTSAARRWEALDRPVPTADGYLVVSADSVEAQSALRSTCGLPATAPDTHVAQRLGTRPAAEWASELCDTGIPAAQVCTDLTTLPTDPRLGKFLERTNDACWVPGAPWDLATHAGERAREEKNRQPVRS